MAGISFATPETVKGADLEGVTTGYEDKQIDYWLGRAERAILAAAPADVLTARIEAGAVDRDAPADIQVDLVLGKLGNPGGVRTVQETNGPASGSVTYGGDTPGQLTLTAEHRRALGIPTRGNRAARTVPTWG